VRRIVASAMDLAPSNGPDVAALRDAIDAQLAPLGLDDGFRSWLESIEGARVDWRTPYVHPSPTTPITVARFRLVRNRPATPLTVPPLRPLALYPGHPPLRVYGRE
jgi:hypothetical protein